MNNFTYLIMVICVFLISCSAQNSEHSRKEKRGILSSLISWGFGTHLNQGIQAYPASPAWYPLPAPVPAPPPSYPGLGNPWPPYDYTPTNGNFLTGHIHSWLAKKFGYPVKVPVAVPVDRPVPVPYPVHVDRHIPVPIDRPYPVAVPFIKHIKVPVPTHKTHLHAITKIKEYLTAPAPSTNPDPWLHGGTNW